MPRYRKLHVKTTESLDINDMPDDFTRLMWVLMPLGLCREGRGIDNPAWIKSKLFPLRSAEDVTSDMICAAMAWYEQRGMIRRYQVGDRHYFLVPTFHDYQGNTTREAETNYPPPPEETTQDSRPTQDLLTTNSSSDAVCNIQYADTKQESGASAPAADAAPGGNGPTTFKEWQAYIRDAKGKKGGCQAAVHYMIETLYCDLDPPAYSYIASTARKVGGFGRLADLLWQHNTRPPTGDLMAYVLAISKRRIGEKPKRKTVEPIEVTAWEDS
jgi:hypothetical protein